MGITAGYSISIYFALAVTLTYGLKQTPVYVEPLLRQLAPNFFCSLLTALVFFYVRYATGWEMAAPWLAVYAVAGAAAYVGLRAILPGGREALSTYWNYARKAIPQIGFGAQP